MNESSESKRAIPTWLTILGWFLGVLIIPFLVARYTSTRAIEVARAEQIETAGRYAKKLEDYLRLQLERRWQDYKQDSLRLELMRSDSLDRIDGDLARRGILDSSARPVSHKRANRHFDYILVRDRREVERFAEDIALHVQSIRETGVILKLE